MKDHFKFYSVLMFFFQFFSDFLFRFILSLFAPDGWRLLFRDFQYSPIEKAHFVFF